MKIVFLDIDGVLNTRSYRKALGLDYFSQLVDRAKLPYLQRIVAETDAKIVLSSSWRKYYLTDGPQLDPAGKCIFEALGSVGLTVYDKTPVRPGNGPRGDDIAAWLDGVSGVWEFVILDDNPIGEDRHLLAHFVQTDQDIGLCDAVVEEAIAVLNGKLRPLPPPPTFWRKIQRKLKRYCRKGDNL